MTDNLAEWQTVDYAADDGERRVLILEGMQPEMGIQLLDLGPLGLPEDVEPELRRHLWARGIRTYADALAPGAADKIAAAMRAALRLSVSTLLDHCRVEQNLLEEAGYE